MAIVRDAPPESLMNLPSPWEGDLPNPATFPRAASSRLRWYFQHKHSGGGNTLADPTDLELSTTGMIQRVLLSFGNTVVYAITPKGEAMLAALRDHARAQRAPHHQLGAHLAQWLAAQGRMTWEDTTFDVVLQSGPATARPDVLSSLITLNPDRWDPQVHEIKVSRADFLSDVRDPSKREAYFRLAPKVFYATPAGLLKKSDIPVECGWVEQDVSGQGRVVRKRAPKLKSWKPWSGRMWLTLVLRSRTDLKSEHPGVAD